LIIILGSVGAAHENPLGGAPFSRLGIYQYDELNRIKKTQNKILASADINSNSVIPRTIFPWETTTPYNETFTYDANGNIKTLTRRDEVGSIMDNLSYDYPKAQNTSLQTNRLANVADSGPDKAGFDDFKPGQIINENPNNYTNDNYTYDESGNLKADVQGGIAQIKWTPANKMEYLKKGTTDNYRIYDGTGQLVLKWQTSVETKGEEYVRDPQGNVMAIYELSSTGARTLREQPIYGSSRVGSYKPNLIIVSPETLPTTPTAYTKFGKRSYEISNHLGNILAVVSDQKDADKKAVVLDKQDYYAFGSPLPHAVEVPLVYFDKAYSDQTEDLKKTDWFDGSGENELEITATFGIRLAAWASKGTQRTVYLTAGRSYDFSATFKELPLIYLSTFPLTLDIIDLATNNVLQHITTTTGNLQFTGFTPPTTGNYKIRIYIPHVYYSGKPNYSGAFSYRPIQIISGIRLG